MIVVNRFANQGPGFEKQADPVVEFWAARPGCRWMELVKSLDDDGLWAIISSWESVGAYRKSFSGYEAKMMLTPLLSMAKDEPSAYLPPGEAGQNLPRGS